MIPSVKNWTVRVLATDTAPEEKVRIQTPTKQLVRIIFRMDFPRYWGREFKISLDKIQR